MQRDGGQSEPQPIDLHRVGTVSNVVRYVTAPDGSHHLVVQGDERFHAIEFLNGWPFLVARVQRISEPEDRTPEIEARFLNLQRQTIEALELLPQVPPELIVAVQSVRCAWRARRSGRRLHGYEAGREAGDPRDDRRVGAHGQGVGAARPSHRGAAAVAGDRPPDQGGARRAPARGAAARADGGHPAAARRRRAEQGAGHRRAFRGDRQGRHAEGGRGPGAQGAAPAWSACRRRRPTTA